MKLKKESFDLCYKIDSLRRYEIQPVIFCPDLWKDFKPPKGVVWKWEQVPFEQESVRLVPDNNHGIYSFVISPNIANHPLNYFLLYIGKAEKMTLRARFRSYFNEIRKMKRIPLCQWLNHYQGYLYFCFCRIHDNNLINDVEQSLTHALLPPGNKQYEGELNKIMKAF